MKPLRYLLPLLLLGFAFAQSPAKSSPSRPEPSEQLSFSAEDTAFQKPVPIPDAAFDILRDDEFVLRTLAAEGIAPHKLPREWFSASDVHLAPGERDLIVMAQGPLRGANICMFWVFVPSPTGLVLALRTAAHDLIAANARTRGHRNLQALSATSQQLTTITYHFEGDEYHTYAHGTQAIK